MNDPRIPEPGWLQPVIDEAKKERTEPGEVTALRARIYEQNLGIKSLQFGFDELSHVNDALRARLEAKELEALMLAGIAGAFLNGSDEARNLAASPDGIREALRLNRERTETFVRARLEAAQAEVADWRRSAALAASETCGDERHCACVPLLRTRLEAAEKVAEAARKAVASRANFNTFALSFALAAYDALGKG